MSVLTYQDILAACRLQPGDSDDRETDSGPIRPCLKKNVRSAGYDLRLGLEYYLHEEAQGNGLTVSTLTPGVRETVVIPANRVVIVTTHEALSLRSDLVGHLSLKLELLLKGLIMANQSQIDAGYSGWIFALLYNLSNQDVCLGAVKK